MYRLITESLLGLRLEVDRLRFEPCLPAGWGSFKMHYRYRETVYHIEIVQGAGQAGITIDGEAHEGDADSAGGRPAGARRGSETEEGLTTSAFPVSCGSRRRSSNRRRVAGIWYRRRVRPYGPSAFPRLRPGAARLRVAVFHLVASWKRPRGGAVAALLEVVVAGADFLLRLQRIEAVDLGRRLTCLLPGGRPSLSTACGFVSSDRAS